MIKENIVSRLSLSRHINSESDEPIDTYSVLLDYCTIIGFTTHVFFVFLFSVSKLWVLAAFNLLSVTLWFTAHFILQRGYKKTSQILGTFEVILHAIIATIFLGWYSGFHYYIVCIICFSFFTPHWKTSAQIMANCTAFFIYFGLSLYTQNVTPVISCSDIHLNIFNFLNMTATIVFLAFYAFLYKKLENEYNKKLQADNKKLSIMAITDPLTSLFNRRGIVYAANELVVSADEYILALCDIDDFKIFNERYGHECGDYVLKGVAEVVAASANGYGTVGRWGGEEFLIILNQCNSIIGKRLIEEIQKKIETSIFYYDGQKLSVTMTFGYTISSQEENLSIAVKRADRALRTGKTVGKNCTVKQ